MGGRGWMIETCGYELAGFLADEGYEPGDLVGWYPCRFVGNRPVCVIRGRAYTALDWARGGLASYLQEQESRRSWVSRAGSAIYGQDVLSLAESEIVRSLVIAELEAELSVRARNARYQAHR